MKNLRKNIRAFTLIEVLVAIVIFSIGMLGLVKLQGVITLNSAESRMYTQAVNHAQDKIEDFRNYVHQATYDDYESDAVGNDEVGTNATFNRTWVVNNNLGFKEVTVTVNWIGVDGENKNVVLTSQIAEVEPSRSGLVLAAVPLVGLTAADIAAQAAAHAAAAAQYEALVANVQSGADADQRAAAQDALAEAEQAADNAEAAAEDNNAAEAANQAAIAYAAMQKILAILNSLGTIPFTFSGTVDGDGDLLVTASYNDVLVECPTDADVYTCTINALQNAVVNVTAENAQEETQTCELIMSINGVEGCDLTFMKSCTTPWGGTVKDGSQTFAFSEETALAPEKCIADKRETRQCNDGDLSGSYLFQTCSNLCTVPELIGDSTGKASDIIAIDKKITDSNLIVGTKNSSGSPPKVVKSQSPSGGAEIECGAAVSYVYAP